MSFAKPKKPSQSLFTFILIAGLPVALVACGETRGDRALSGAGIGAAAGTVGSVITGGNPATGAIIGGAAGAATGAITDPDDVNLGRPWWKR